MGQVEGHTTWRTRNITSCGATSDVVFDEITVPVKAFVSSALKSPESQTYTTTLARSTYVFIPQTT